MRRLLKISALLFPRGWRERYGREFYALLDDVNPRWTDILNVLRGALKMQLTQGNFWKFAAGFAVAGLLVASAWCWFAIPDKYRFTGVLAMPVGSSQVESTVRLQEIREQLLTRTSMWGVIKKHNLYEGERKHEPLEDVIEKMRAKDIRIRALPAGAFSIDFDYADRSKAESATKDLVARMQSAGGLRVLRLSGSIIAPNRLRIACFGLGLGLLIGVAAGGTLRLRRRTIAICGVCGLAGFLVAGAISFRIPDRYISTAVVRVADLPAFQREVLSRESLAAVIDSGGLYRDERPKKSIDQLVDTMRAKDLRVQAMAGVTSSTALKISFSTTEPYVAQSVILELLRRYREPLPMEVLDAPNMPMSPAYPNRYVIEILGVSLGLLSGGVFARVRRPAVA